MKRIIVTIILSLSAWFLLSSPLSGVQKTKKPKKSTQAEAKVGTEPKETYTGTIIKMSGGTASTGFTMVLNGRTSDDEAARYRSILADQGQDDLLKVISKNSLGYIAATGHTRRELLVVREGEINGNRRIVAAFERWVGFYEARGGYRSMDYPYSIIEVVFDQKGRGTGTFIGLAQVDMKTDKKTQQTRLEIENFGSFPSKVMGVMRRDK